MKKLQNVHPEEILKLDFLDEMKIWSYELGKAIGVDQTRISQLIKGTRSLSADTAIRLGKFFNVSPEFCLNIQSRFDLEHEREKNSEYEREQNVTLWLNLIAFNGHCWQTFGRMPRCC